jgi:hypothetical protein
MQELCLFVVVLNSVVRDPKAPILCLVGWWEKKRHTQTAVGPHTESASCVDT